MFENIGKKFLDPNFQEKVEEVKNIREAQQSVSLDRNKVKPETKEEKKKKGCC